MLQDIHTHACAQLFDCATKKEKKKKRSDITPDLGGHRPHQG
jgi:hypothetical protein